MACVEVNPVYADLFRRHGVTTTDEFLAWPGVIMGGHADRLSVQVETGDGTRFYLKKEHYVPWRDWLASAWAGFGWVSKSVREGRLLQEARQAGIGCPEVAAVGETGGRAFLLLRAAEGLIDLRAVLARSLSRLHRRALAHALGRTLAQLHMGGFAHPDLYAKHILAGYDGERYRFCLLDWARARRHGRVSWRRRMRGLAALDASLADSLVSQRLRVACLRAYFAAMGEPACPLRPAVEAIRRMSDKLLLRRKVRALRQSSAPNFACAGKVAL
jgi:tRNA A-37 threonylcarbamoyl transferase component Bud32